MAKEGAVMGKRGGDMGYWGDETDGERGRSDCCSACSNSHCKGKDQFVQTI